MAMINSENDAALSDFIDKAMVADPSRDHAALLTRLREIRKTLAPLQDGLGIMGEADGIRLMFSAGGVEQKLKVELGPEGISDLYLLKTEPSQKLELTRDNLAETIQRLETEGRAGVIYLKLDGEIVMQQAFGMANKEMGIINKIHTIFGTGSRPIDYTVAAILLLDQQGKIKLDDSIDNYFPDVPTDKRKMTIRHLMRGQSGLPDFFDTDDDWDPDLAWVDRTTAEQRLLSAKLLFEPGKERRHSHAAFGLLAALVERVSGISYYGFLRKYFFDPAGMDRTGEYGESRDLSIPDFAVGYGFKSVGLPNIPPNWGPTSWLIKGSGGMYSTLGDLLKFYQLVRSERVLDKDHNRIFHRETSNLDGSERGFELFSAYYPPGNEVYLFLNNPGNPRELRPLFRALEGLVRGD